MLFRYGYWVSKNTSKIPTMSCDLKICFTLKNCFLTTHNEVYNFNLIFYSEALPEIQYSKEKSICPTFESEYLFPDTGNAE